MRVGTLLTLIASCLASGCGADPLPEATAQTAAKGAGPTATPANSDGRSPPNLWTRDKGVDWPHFLGLTRDSKSPETGIIAPWPEEGLKIVWQRRLHESYGIGSVARGRFFQFDRVGDKANLVALNAETGKELWEFSYPTDYSDFYGYNGGPRCSPVIDDDRVYIYGAAGMLHCLRVEDGKPVWKVDTVKNFGVVQNFFGVGSTPVIEGDLLIAMVGGSPAESQDVGPGFFDRVVGNGTGVVAFDKFTGEVKYQITDELAGYAAPQLATIDGRRWCFVFARGGLIAFEPAEGAVDFHFPWRAKILESVNASTPVVVGDEVFISETYGPGSSLLKVRPGGYDIVWQDHQRRREKAMQTHWNTAVHHDGYLYGSSGRHEYNAELRCVEWKTGKVMWSEPGLTRASLLYVDGHFICLSEDGVLRLLRANPKKYDLVSEWTPVDKTAKTGAFGFGPPRLLKPPAWAAPILSHGLLYVRGDDRLVCMKLIPEK
ncbi:MAG: PQQ-like beta-propeller repeat protein [Planctomycetes bacterium]|nr:PQQ-like beta-propeller repeat protein [Planctomycetota bacterium]